jgi:RNA polymerase sigma-70 factor (ECF subfamily)
MDTHEDTHDDLRPLLFSIAYRMLGSVAEAEDVVQETFVRYQQAGADAVAESPKSYLASITTRLAIDHLRSARVRRETYPGQWLPEPIVEETPADLAETADSLSMAFLVLLEQLSPVERAVFLLREVFGYEFDEIARTVERSEANCRQILVRARAHVSERRPRFESSPQKREELAQRFFAACRDGDHQALVGLLAADAAVYGDGGGKVHASPQPIVGREHVANALIGFTRVATSMALSFQPAWVNGQPGAVFHDRDGRAVWVASLDIVDGAIVAVRSVLNPDKLAHIP